MKTFIKKKT